MAGQVEGVAILIDLQDDPDRVTRLTVAPARLIKPHCPLLSRSPCSLPLEAPEADRSSAPRAARSRASTCDAGRRRRSAREIWGGCTGYARLPLHGRSQSPGRESRNQTASSL